MYTKIAFNDTKVNISNDIKMMADKVSSLIPVIHAFSALKEGEDFGLKMSQMTINGLNLIAYAQSGIYLERDDCKGFDLLIPMEGQNHTVVGRTKYQFNAGETAFLAASERRQSTLRRNGVNIGLNADRLNKTCASIMGVEDKKVIDLNIRTPSLQHNKIKFSILFKSIFNHIDFVDGNKKILNRLLLDDYLYRLCAALLHPELFLVGNTFNGKEPQVRQELGLLCEWMNGHIQQPISLTQMEEQSGLSSRVLQYSFKKSFGMRPVEWLRKQRIHAAHAILMKSDKKINITELSYDLCFSSQSEFGRYYKKEFGETPSDTIKRQRH